eukprot:scaffold66420_cov18-Tisochrysis_lutea.AAC.1
MKSATILHYSDSSPSSSRFCSYRLWCDSLALFAFCAVLQDVSCLLYKDLHIPTPASAEQKKTGHISAKSADLLDMRFEHDVVPIILEHRHLRKQLELLESVIPRLCQEDARAHQYTASFC